MEVGLNGQSASCSAKPRMVEVHGKPQVDLELSAYEGCDNLLVTAEELAEQGASYACCPMERPQRDRQPPISLTTVGTHLFTVTVTDAFGCQNVASDLATVHPSPVAAFVAADVCEGVESTFTDTTLPGGGNAIQSWTWTFGDEGTSDLQHPQLRWTGCVRRDPRGSGRHCDLNTQNLVVNTEPGSGDVVDGCSP